MNKFIPGIVIALMWVAVVQVAKRSPWTAGSAAPLARQKGPLTARVQLVEYSDFQCPVCRDAQSVIHDLLKHYGQDVRLTFKHLPLEKIHSHARAAALAAECAAAQKKFWPYHDLLYEKQQEWSKAQSPEESFRQYAQTVGLDIARFDACGRDTRIHATIDRDMNEAKIRDIHSTPTFFIGPERVIGTQQLLREGARLIERAKRK